MVFSSVVFLFFFFPAVLALYVPLRNRPAARNFLLLLASLIFYFWGEGRYTIVILVYIVCNFWIAKFIERLKTQGTPGAEAKAKTALVLGVAFNLTLLVYYKYFGFLIANVNEVLGWAAAGTLQVSAVHLPIGISFFTFQGISYVVDVYRGDVSACKSLLNFATYKAFFPQLIAGPIVRYRDVAGQVPNHSMNRELFCSGIERFIVGLAKKLIIANTVAAAADEIFKIPGGEISPGVAWLGIICYSLQIYFDFSGYSDMAIGMARMFGFRFLENFDYPYIAQSIKEFWRRWHISLSTWFRDYLYIPLGGNRGSLLRVYFNLVLVFFLCGLWHGASWAFVVWGLWHGLFLVAERTSFGEWIARRSLPLRSAYTLLVVAIGWVFFRADTLSYALQYLAAAFGAGASESVGYPFSSYWNMKLAIAIALGILFSAPVAPAIGNKFAEFLERLRAQGGAAYFAHTVFSGVKSAGYLLLLLLAAVQLASGTHNPFIYFRF